jgi:hypothetical protein
MVSLGFSLVEETGASDSAGEGADLGTSGEGSKRLCCFFLVVTFFSDRRVVDFAAKKVAPLIASKKVTVTMHRQLSDTKNDADGEQYQQVESSARRAE